MLAGRLLLASGTRLASLSYAERLDVTLALCVEGATAEQRDEFMDKLAALDAPQEPVRGVRAEDLMAWAQAQGGDKVEVVISER